MQNDWSKFSGKKVKAVRTCQGSGCLQFAQSSIPWRSCSEHDCVSSSFRSPHRNGAGPVWTAGQGRTSFDLPWVSVSSVSAPWPAYSGVTQRVESWGALENRKSNTPNITTIQTCRYPERSGRWLKLLLSGMKNSGLGRAGEKLGGQYVVGERLSAPNVPGCYLKEKTPDFSLTLAPCLLLWFLLWHHLFFPFRKFALVTNFMISPPLPYQHSRTFTKTLRFKCMCPFLYLFDHLLPQSFPP